MSEQTPESASGSLSLPDAPNLEWLRTQAKRRLDELRKTNPAAKLASAQFDLAKQYGFSSWRALKAHVDSLTVEGQLFDAAKNGDVDRLVALLDKQVQAAAAIDGIVARAAGEEVESRTPGDDVVAAAAVQVNDA